jgi:hypothetical protein
MPSENRKKSAENRNKTEMEEKIDNTNQSEVIKERMKQTNKEKNDKKREKMDATVES